MLYPSNSKLEWAQTRSGLIVPADLQKRKPRGFDFFAGCGGFSCGFKKAGFQIVGALEMDFSAAQTYMVNLGAFPIKLHFDTPERKDGFNKHLEKQLKAIQKRNSIIPMSETLYDRVLTDAFGVSGSGWISTQKDMPGCEHFWIADIKSLTGKKILKELGMERGELDVVIGGPPCQGMSKAGKQDESDPRNILVWEYARMIVELNPKSFVMEEVPDVFDFKTAEGIGILDGFLRILADGDFAPMESLQKAMFGRKNSKAILRQEKKESWKKPSKSKNAPTKTNKNTATQRKLF